MPDDYSIEAFKEYILDELKKHKSLHLLYFTDNTNLADRKQITRALNDLVQYKQVVRISDRFTLR